MSEMLSIADAKGMARAVNELAPMFAGTKRSLPHNLGTRVNPKINAEFVDKYDERVRKAISRAYNCMETKELVFNVITYGEDVDPKAYPEGYDHICKRIKHPETTAREKKDLLQAKKIYELFDEMKRVGDLISNGDHRKAIKIMSGRR